MGLVKTLTGALRARKSAESKVEELQEIVARWHREAETRREELAGLHASAGPRVLAAGADGDGARAAARMAAVEAQELQFLIDGARAAAQAAEEQLRDARWALDLARAAEKRQEAARLTGQAAAHQAKVDELLHQLTELDGATYIPEPELEGEARRSAIHNGGYLAPIRPKAELIREPVAQLLADAEALEARVAAEQADLREKTSPVVPWARLDFPDPLDTYGDTKVHLAVNDGIGSATFEVWVNANCEQTVTLPDENGKRRFGTKVRVPAGGGRAQVRCSGQVIAEGVRPGRRVPTPSGGYIQLAKA